MGECVVHEANGTARGLAHTKLTLSKGPCAELRAETAARVALQGKFDALQEETAELKRENEARKRENEALQGKLENDMVLREAALLLFDEAARSVVPKLRNKTDGVRPFARFNQQPNPNWKLLRRACRELCGIEKPEYFALLDAKNGGNALAHPRVTPEKLRRALDSLEHLDGPLRTAVAKILRSAGTILH